MKRLALLGILFLIISSCSKSGKKQSYEAQIKEFQYRLNVEYSDKKTSPLTDEDFKTFKSLDYFPIDPTYKITASLIYVYDAPLFKMQTTTNRLPLYKTYALAKFTLKGKEFEIPIYQSQELILDPKYTDYLFLPFKDLTNGKESYAGGRFLDLELPKKGDTTMVIDFNLAYNPYCAYNHKYSCPIPPDANILDIAIPVGVKAYGKH
ncbi:MAG: DUF1684 domain-containing protein [Flavobacteriaceae bacterium]|nr:DUF1684 domain-containing protein [Flavobacteriaceae bacterium]